MLLSGEGLLRLERYPDSLIRALTECAAEAGVPLREPFRYRLATDGQVPLRAGYPVAVISSMDWYKAPSNYHWPSDRPENLDLGSVARAAALAESFVRHLDDLASGSVVDHLDGHAAGLRRAAISPEPGLTGQGAGRPHQPLR
jgi:hypothetical protein